MPEFSEEMVAGFHQATRARSAKSEASGGSEVRRRRVRERTSDGTGPATGKIIESNALRRVIDAIVKLETEKAEVGDSIKAEYAAAKDAGYDVKALRFVVKRVTETAERKVAREEVELTAAQMMAALGMLADTPLGRAAMGSSDEVDGDR